MQIRLRLALALLLALGTAVVQAQEAVESETRPEAVAPRSSEPEPSATDYGSPAAAEEEAALAEAPEGVLNFVRAAGSNFAPRDSTTTFSYSGGGCLQRNSNTGDSWFTYDLQLPDGAEIDFLRVYFYDADGTNDINSELWAFDGAGGTTLIAQADSSGAPGYSSAGSPFFSHFVDNTNESLVVIASIQGGVGANLKLCGIRIRYQGPNLFLDGFETGDTSRWSNVVPIVHNPPEASSNL